jgi:hypothetical protein
MGVFRIVRELFDSLKDLFKPSWASEDEKTAVCAVKRIKNQEELYKIATTDKWFPLTEVRFTAISMLSSPEMLFSIYQIGKKYYAGSALTRLEELMTAGVFNNKVIYEIIQKLSTRKVLDHQEKGFLRRAIMKITDTSMLIDIIEINACSEYTASIVLQTLSSNIEIIKEMELSIKCDKIKKRIQNLLSYLNDKKASELEMQKIDAKSIFKVCYENPLFIDLADDISTVIEKNQFFYDHSRRWGDGGYDFIKAASRLIKVAESEPERLLPFWHRLEKNINEASISETFGFHKTGHETIMTSDDGPRLTTKMEERISVGKSLGLKFPKLKSDVEVSA